MDLIDIVTAQTDCPSVHGRPNRQILVTDGVGRDRIERDGIRTAQHQPHVLDLRSDALRFNHTCQVEKGKDGLDDLKDVDEDSREISNVWK